MTDFHTEVVTTGYAGPPPLGWSEVFTAWEFDAVPTVLLVALGWWYSSRAYRLRKAGQAWPLRYEVYWILGLGSYALATMSAIAVYSPVLFSARAFQITILMMVTPQLWAHGLPGTLARETASRRGRRIASRILHAGITQRLTHPIVGVGVLIGMPIAFYGSTWYVASLSNQFVDELTQLVFLAGGFHYFWTRLQRDPVPRLYPQVVTVVVTMADVAIDSVVPLALIVTPSIVGAEYYNALGRDWGLSLASDQDVGAGIFWSLGDLAGIPFLLLALSQWIRRDEAEAAIIDSQLDELEARTAAASAEEDEVHPRPSSLWWENDPELAEHFHWRRKQ